MSWRSDTQPYGFLKAYYISIDHIYPSFPVWCICVLPLICVVFKQLSFMAMRKMWIVVCPSKLIKIHWEKDTGQNDASNKTLKWKSRTQKGIQRNCIKLSMYRWGLLVTLSKVQVGVAWIEQPQTPNRSELNSSSWWKPSS